MVGTSNLGSWNSHWAFSSIFCKHQDGQNWNMVPMGKSSWGESMPALDEHWLPRPRRQVVADVGRAGRWSFYEMFFWLVWKSHAYLVEVYNFKNVPVEIVSFPMKNGKIVIFHRFFLTFTRPGIIFQSPVGGRTPNGFWATDCSTKIFPRNDCSSRGVEYCKVSIF